MIVVKENKMDLKEAINKLIALDREVTEGTMFKSETSEENTRKERDKLWTQIYEEIDRLHTKKFPNDLDPYTPIRVHGWVFSDGYNELWCYDNVDERVYHLGAEIEMRLSGQLRLDNEILNGYTVHSLREAFEVVNNNVGD